MKKLPAPLINVSLPTPLRPRCGGRATLTVSASDVRSVLTQIERLHPELHCCICDETGALRRHINVFVDSDHMRDRQGLDTQLQPGTLVTIMTAVSGG